jgi:hypothetical protein
MRKLDDEAEPLLPAFGCERNTRMMMGLCQLSHYCSQPGMECQWAGGKDITPAAHRATHATCHFRQLRIEKSKPRR